MLGYTGPAARNSDRATSHNAGMPTFKRDSWRERVLRLHARFPRGFTDDEIGVKIAENWGLPTFHGCDIAHKRRPDLVNLGLVAETTDERSSLRGFAMTVWIITDKGLALVRMWEEQDRARHFTGPNGSL